MIPNFEVSGLLPPGIHQADWQEIVLRFGQNSHRQWLLHALKRALNELKKAGCTTAYLDGSFVTSKDLPKDYDICWSISGVDLTLLDPVLIKFDDRRQAMNAKYFGDIFPAEFVEYGSMQLFLDFFQTDKMSGDAKGIVMIDLSRLS